MPPFSSDRVGLATYHIPPNFSINPAPSGPIELGSILNNLQDVEVINPDSRIEIPKASIYCHQKHGFTATRSSMCKGEFGVWARLVGMEGIGGELRASHGFSYETEYNFNRLDTFTFTPSAGYLDVSMRELEVAEYVEATDWEPVYLVTGIKVAVGPSIRLTKTASTVGKVEMGLQQASLPVEIGARVGLEREGHISEGWEASDNFIFGLRVKKLVYKRGWLARWRGEERQLRASQFNKGAQLVGLDDDDGEPEEGELIAELDVVGRANAEVEEDGDEEIVWVVPESDRR